MSEHRATCLSCTQFRNDPAYLETVFTGLASLGSAYGSTRADDGLCLRHDRYRGARDSCADYESTSFSIPPPPLGNR
jgi:hypothetical protein